MAFLTNQLIRVILLGNLIFASLGIAHSAPTTGIKNLYFDDVSAPRDLTRTVPTTNSTLANIAQNNTSNFDQSVVFAAPFTITNGTVINVSLYLQRTGGNGERTAQVDIYNGNTGILIGTAGSQSWNAGARQYLTFSYTLTEDEIFSEDDFVQVRVTNNSVLNSGFNVLQRNAAPFALVEMNSSTVINLDEVGIFSAIYPSLVKYQSYVPGTLVYLRATVSDPFGNFDIASVDFTVNDTTATAVSTANVIAASAAPTGSTAVFETSYMIPDPAVNGFWSIDFVANEGTEGTVSHSTTIPLIVGVPILTVTKTSETIYDPVNLDLDIPGMVYPKAIPNSTVEYTIDIENSGFGYLDNNNTVITDLIPAGTSLQVTPSPVDFDEVASGLSFTFTTLNSSIDDVDFSNDNGTTWTYYHDGDFSAISGGGFDSTVTDIRINPKGEFAGRFGSTNPSAQFKFRVNVD